MKRADEYKELAQLALDEKLAGEAQAALEQGFTKKVFTDQRDVGREQAPAHHGQERSGGRESGARRSRRRGARDADGR